MSLSCETSVHDSKVLIGERKIQHNVRLVAVDKSDELVNVVGVHLSSLDDRFSSRLELLLERVALRLGAARNHDALKSFAVLAALVDSNGSNSSAADNHTFSHCYDLLLSIIFCFFYAENKEYCYKQSIDAFDDYKNS